MSSPGIDIKRLEQLPDDLAFSELKNALLMSTAPPPGEEVPAAAFALRLGVPELALSWATASAQAQGAAIAAAAALRLGRVEVAQTQLETLAPEARRAVLEARARMLGGETGLDWAHAARTQARQEGDAPALIAAVTLLGERQLSEPFAALRTLAEGLKVAELMGDEADAHLLAVLSHAQKRAGSASKAERTAEKALERSWPRSPARVWSLLALNRETEAEAQRQLGQLAPAWFAGVLL